MTARTSTSTPRTAGSARCLCGLRIAMHRGRHNESLSCADARDYHRYATICFKPLRELMLRSVEASYEVVR